MKKDQIKFLKKLVETPSPTGSEEKVAEIVRTRLSDCADEIQTDIMGSVHAILAGDIQRGGYIDENGEYVYDESMESAAYDDDIEAGVTQISTPVFMLAAHMDEIGLMVTYISDDGFLSISAIGGVDPAILPGMRVDVHTESGTLRGIVGRKPIHLIEAEERKNVTSLDKLVIDLGLPAKTVKKKVRVGDSITFGVGFERLGKKCAVSKSFDDKCGVFIACSVLEALAENGQMKGSFIAAITTQEEIGTRGATTSAFSINPDVAVAFDVTHATDYPGIDKSKYGNIRLGGGPVIARGPNINPYVYERLVAAAEAEGIQYQIEAEPSVTGTDARAIQIAQSGIPTGLVSVPLRYMHTPNEMIDLNDVEDTIKLLTRFALDLEQEATFVPGVSPAIEHPYRDENAAIQEVDDTKREIKKLKKQIKELNARLFPNEEDEEFDGVKLDIDHGTFSMPAMSSSQTEGSVPQSDMQPIGQMNSMQQQFAQPQFGNMQPRPMQNMMGGMPAQMQPQQFNQFPANGGQGMANPQFGQNFNGMPQPGMQNVNGFASPEVQNMGQINPVEPDNPALQGMFDQMEQMDAMDEARKLQEQSGDMSELADDFVEEAAIYEEDAEEFVESDYDNPDQLEGEDAFSQQQTNFVQQAPVARSLDVLPQAMNIQSSPEFSNQFIKPISALSALDDQIGDMEALQGFDAAQHEAMALDDETIEYQSDADVIAATEPCAPEGFPGIDSDGEIQECYIPEDEDE